MTNSQLLLIGFIAQTAGSILLLLGYAPQIFKSHKTLNPTGISLLFWTMIGIGCTAIDVNMVISHAPLYVIITQSLNAFFAWYTLFLVMYCRRVNNVSIKMNKVILVIAVILAIFVVYETQVSSLIQVGHVFQTIGTIALLTAYLPQIFHLYRVKDATGISRWLFIVLGMGLLLLTVNYIVSQVQLSIIVTEFVNIAMIMIQYVLTVYYQNKKVKNI